MDIKQWSIIVNRLNTIRPVNTLLRFSYLFYKYTKGK